MLNEDVNRIVVIGFGRLHHKGLFIIVGGIGIKSVFQQGGHDMVSAPLRGNMSHFIQISGIDDFFGDILQNDFAGGRTG